MARGLGMVVLASATVLAWRASAQVTPPDVNVSNIDEILGHGSAGSGSAGSGSAGSGSAGSGSAGSGSAGSAEGSAAMPARAPAGVGDDPGSGGAAPPSPGAAAPAAKPEPARELADSGGVVGLELGRTYGRGDDGAFGDGTGRSWMFGLRWHRTSLEWRLDSYAAEPVSANLRAAGLAGDRAMWSVAVTHGIVPWGPVTPTLTVGLAHAGRPVIIADENMHTYTWDQSGWGAVLGAGLRVRLHALVSLVAAARWYPIAWDDIGDGITARDIVTHPVDAGSKTSYTPAMKSDGGNPLTVTIGIELWPR